RESGASLCQLGAGGEQGAQVGWIRFGTCGGRCCLDGAMFGSGSYPQMPVLVSDQRVYGISRDLRTGQLYRLTEQLVISALEPVRAPSLARGRGGFPGGEAVRLPGCGQGLADGRAGGWGPVGPGVQPEPE